MKLIDLTPAQADSENRLEKVGFIRSTTDGETLFMTARLGRHGNYYGDIEPDGSVSGQTIDAFLASFRAAKKG